VGKATGKMIWIPKIIFENDQNKIFTQFKDLSIVRIKRLGNPLKKFNFVLNEFEEYDGSESPLIFENSYELKLNCELDLHYFPFDTQHCFINVSKIYQLLYLQSSTIHKNRR
jgi:hypothetical protein